MRTHPSREYDFSEYDALSREDKDRLQRRENPERASRFRKMKRKRCNVFPERGIRLNTLPPGTGVQRIIQQQGWEHFVRTPSYYDPQLVAEFYACMHPPTFMHRDTVIVKGVQVRITPEDICAYHGVAHKPHLARSYGLSGNDIFKVPFNPIIASSLRRNGFDRWDSTHSFAIMKSDLPADLGFLMLFIKASLKPSKYNTSADPQIAEVLYSLQHGFELDIGQIIWLEMLDAGVSLDGILPFPSLITAFCMRAGVPVGQLVEPPEDFKNKQYNIQISAAAKLDEKRRQDPDYWVREMAAPQDPDSDEYQDPDFDPTEPVHQPYGHQLPYPDDTPQYIYQLSQNMMSHIDLRTGEINQRLDQAGIPALHRQTSSGEGREERRERRRRVRTRREGTSGQGAGSSSGRG